MTRRQYSREFKISAVKLVNEQDYSVVKAARSLGIDPSSVRQMAGEVRSGSAAGRHHGGVPPDRGAQTAAAECRTAHGTRYFKKAAAYFTKEPS